MITSILKQILADSGCTLVLYEQDRLANLYTDQSHQSDIVGLILQPNTVTLEVKANAVHEHFPPVYIEVLQQVNLENNADANEAKLAALLEICKEIIIRLIDLQEFTKLQSVTVSKVLENKYDANMIGWSMPLDLFWLHNRVNDPCDPVVSPEL